MKNKIIENMAIRNQTKTTVQYTFRHDIHFRQFRSTYHLLVPIVNVLRINRTIKIEKQTDVAHFLDRRGDEKLVSNFIGVHFPHILYVMSYFCKPGVCMKINIYHQGEMTPN